MPIAKQINRHWVNEIPGTGQTGVKSFRVSNPDGAVLGEFPTYAEAAAYARALPTDSGGDLASAAPDQDSTLFRNNPKNGDGVSKLLDD